MEDCEDCEVCEVCKIPKNDFLALIHQNRDVSAQFMKMLAGDVVEKERQLLSLAYDTVRKKVAEGLLRLESRYRETGQKNFKISIPRDDLAGIAGIATETVIRSLSEFKDDGLIQIEGREIVILDSQIALKDAMAFFQCAERPCHFILLKTYMVPVCKAENVIKRHDQFKVESLDVLKKELTAAKEMSGDGQTSFETLSQIGSPANVISRLVGELPIGCVVVGINHAWAGFLKRIDCPVIVLPGHAPALQNEGRPL